MSQPRILVADNSANFRRVITMMLQREGYDLALASNGFEALQQTLKVKPDLILLDYDLAGVDGLKLCQVIKTYPLVSSIPVLFFAGRTAGDVGLNNVFAAGGLEYLDKPIRSQELFDKLNIHLNRGIYKEGRKISLQPLGVQASIGAIRGDRLLLESPSMLEKIRLSDEIEIVCQDAADGTVYRQQALRQERDSERLNAFWFALSGGIFRSQNRHFFRKAIELPLRYRLEGDFYRLGFAADISGGGVKIQNVAPSARPGTEIQMELRLPDLKDPLVIKGQVVRISEQADEKLEIGVVFQEIAPKDQTDLIMFLFGEIMGAERRIEI